MNDVLARLAAQRILPVIRTDDPLDAVATAHACAAAGVTVVELTCTTPDVADALDALRDTGLCIGLGTVRSTADVRTAIGGGAAFVVSFTNPPEMIAEAHRAGLAAIPGALTPTEVSACAAQGADAVKLFPARMLAPDHLADLRAVLPDVRIMVTGGLRPADSARWLAAGAVAVGLGSVLGTVATAGAAAVTRRTAAALAAATVPDNDREPST